MNDTTLAQVIVIAALTGAAVVIILVLKHAGAFS